MSPYKITKAGKADLEEILALQYLAYQSEAALFGNKDIPPLKETIGEVEAEYDKGLILKDYDTAATHLSEFFADMDSIDWTSKPFSADGPAAAGDDAVKRPEK